MAGSIFVTGGNGFVGQRLLQLWAASADCNVTVLTRRPQPEETLPSGRFRQVVGDLLDPATYQAALAGCDVVAHLAAATGRAAPADYDRVNVAGTRALLQASKAAGVRRFLHVSTIAAGYADQRYYAYAKTKARAEALVEDSGLEFAIVRPTLVLGQGSPIWHTLLKIAKLPVVPLPQGARPVSVQPIHVDDLARGIALLLESGTFKGEVLELGGPRALAFREFLGLVQEALRGKRGRIVSVPLAPVRTLLAMMEPVARPVMPVTAGQLALFANDSVAAENWLQARLRPSMPSTEEMVAALVDTGQPRPGGRGSPPDDKRRQRPMSADAARVLEAECRALSPYLVGAAPNPYVVQQYARAAHARGLAFDDELSSFDRVTLKIARAGRPFARCADAYCAILHRRGALRRKLIVLAAILEHVAPTSEAFDGVEPRSLAGTMLSLMRYGWASAVSLVLGAVILLPASVLCWLAARSPGFGGGARRAQ